MPGYFVFTRLWYVSLALPRDNLSQHHINFDDIIDDNKTKAGNWPVWDLTPPDHSFMDFHSRNMSR